MRTRTARFCVAAGALAALTSVVLGISVASSHSLQLAAAETTTDEAELLEWSSDLDCTGCHANEAMSQESAVEAEDEDVDALEATASLENASDAEDTELTAVDPATEGENEAEGETEDEAENAPVYQIAKSHGALQCVICHDDEEGLVKAHAKVTVDSTKVAKRLKKTEVAAETCLACHEATYSAEATAESTALTDTNGTVVNPHDLPESENHSGIACASCHSMHTTDNIATTAAQTCTKCHHANVYECGTCH